MATFQPAARNPFRRESYAFSPVLDGAEIAKDMPQPLDARKNGHATSVHFSIPDFGEGPEKETDPNETTLTNSGFNQAKGAGTDHRKGVLQDKQEAPNVPVGLRRRPSSAVSAAIRRASEFFGFARSLNNADQPRSIPEDLENGHVDTADADAAPNNGTVCGHVRVASGPPRVFPEKQASTDRLSIQTRRRRSTYHPGLPTMGFASQQMIAGVGASRRASVVVANGEIHIDELPAKLGRKDARSARQSRDCVAGAAPALGSLLPSVASMPSFVSANEFPDGYLLGFSNCEEVLEPIELEVEGSIPDWVSGVFYRCGPGKFDVETEIHDTDGDNRVVAIDHWFDGFSLLHRFQVKDGKVFYRNRFTAEIQESTMKKTGALPLSFAQQDPCKGFFKKFFTISLDVPKEFNVNVAVTPRFPVRVGGAKAGAGAPTEWREVLLAKTDANIIQEIDEATLEPKGWSTYTALHKKFKGIMTSAHEIYDDETDEYINFLQEPGPVIRTHVFSVSKRHPEGGEVIATILSRRASYMHSFAVTRRYIVLICCPYFWSYGGIPIVFTKTVVSALEWHGHLPVYFYVIDRKLKKCVSVFEGDPFFVFHVINAYHVPTASSTAGETGQAASSEDEELHDIVIDLCAYRSPSNIDEMYMDKFRNGTTNFESSHIRRYRLPCVNKAEVSGDKGVDVQADQAGGSGGSGGPFSAFAKWLRPGSSLSSSGRRKTFDAADAGSYPRALFEILSGPGPEMPVVNPAYLMSAACRYVYCVVASARMPFEALVKHDLHARTSIEWRQTGCYPSEPVFVARGKSGPGVSHSRSAHAEKPDAATACATEEDDGLVMSVVLDGSRASSFLLVLDAKTFKEVGRAHFDSGRVVPFGFHGTYLDYNAVSEP